jgi:hypothetical protein
MKNLFLFLLIIFFTAIGCRENKKAPDTSGIKIELTVQRFEKDFFALDTTNLNESLNGLKTKYPVFFRDFMEQILGIPSNDTTGMALTAIRQFLSDYRPVKTEADKSIADFAPIEKELRKGLANIKFYFPEYPLPSKLITFIGPMDAYAEGQTGGYGDIITTDALGVGLQLHLGAASFYYTGELGQRLYPSYISRRFTPDYIPVNCIKNIIDDLYEGNPNDKTLLDLMVDKGKRLYLLERFLPETADSLRIGYTGDQLEGAEKNEGLIWNFFVENNLLYDADMLKIKSYVGDGPKTNELGDGSPGYISLFTGRAIVRKYMENFPDTDLKKLLQLDAKTILNESKYKPR